MQPLLRTGRDKEEQIPEKMPVLLPPSGTARCILYVIIYMYIFIYCIYIYNYAHFVYIYIFGVWALARMPVESKSVMVL